MTSSGKISFLMAAALCGAARFAGAADSALSDHLLSPVAAIQTQALKDVSGLTDDQKKQLVPALTQALRQDSAMAERAAKALASLGPQAAPAIPQLVDALHFDEESTAKEIEAALIQAGPASIRPLEKVLGDSNFFVRRRAAETLAAFGSKAKHAAPALVQLTMDANTDVHAAAENALVQMKDDAVPALAEALRGSDDTLRRIVIGIMGRIGNSAVPYLSGVLKKDGAPALREDAAAALGNLKTASPAAVEALIEGLNDLQEGVRVQAASSLGQLGASAKAAVGALLSVSREDKDANVRQRAADALASIGPASNDSVPGLIKALKLQDDDLRRDVAVSVGQSSLSVKEALPVLAIVLKEGSIPSRMAAVHAAGSLDHQKGDALPLLATALTDPEPQVRGAAIDEMGKSKSTPEVADKLIAALKDPNPVLRQQIIHSLGKLGMAGAPGLIQELSDSMSLLSDDAAQELVKIGPEVLPLLKPLEDGADPALKRRAADIRKRIQRKHQTAS